MVKFHLTPLSALSRQVCFTASYEPGRNSKSNLACRAIAWGDQHYENLKSPPSPHGFGAAAFAFHSAPSEG